MAVYFALLGFIAFMVGTPGPANLLAMLAGVRQGLRGCIGFISGLVFGKILLNLLIGLVLVLFLPPSQCCKRRLPLPAPPT